MIIFGSHMGLWLMVLWAVSAHQCLLTAAQCIGSHIAHRTTQLLAAVAMVSKGMTQELSIDECYENQAECNLIQARALLVCCRRAFKPFMDEGYLSFVYGGGEEGKYVCNNPAVDSIHLTGSEATYNAIVWGPGNPKVSTCVPTVATIITVLLLSFTADFKIAYIDITADTDA